jgi:general secretion pathway protein G
MKGQSAFTLIELLVVLAVIALMLTIAVPRYVDRVEMARETALKTDLKVMREAIDHFDGDQGRLPKGLDELVMRRYLNGVPLDPITGRSDTWVSISAADDALLHVAPTDTSKTAPADNTPPVGDGLADVHSGAPGKGRDGTEFKDW